MAVDCHLPAYYMNMANVGTAEAEAADVIDNMLWWRITDVRFVRLAHCRKNSVYGHGDG